MDNYKMQIPRPLVGGVERYEKPESGKLSFTIVKWKRCVANRMLIITKENKHQQMERSENSDTVFHKKKKTSKPNKKTN